LWGKQYPLAEFSAATNFKSYDELKTRLNVVLSGTTMVGNVEDEDIPFDSTVTVDTKEEPAPSIEVAADNEEEDTLSYFEKLAEAE
jgi:hypothetical protein